MKGGVSAADGDLGDGADEVFGFQADIDAGCLLSAGRMRHRRCWSARPHHPHAGL